MNEAKRLMVQGMDMLLKKFNRKPDSTTVTVEEIIAASNEVYDEITSLNADSCGWIFLDEEDPTFPEFDEDVLIAYVTESKEIKKMVSSYTVLLTASACIAKWNLPEGCEEKNVKAWCKIPPFEMK